MAREKKTTSDWKTFEKKMIVRRGHGPWIQVRVPQADGSEKLFIMREVKSFREQASKEVSL
jgi:hypothetical protein